MREWRSAFVHGVVCWLVTAVWMVLAGGAAAGSTLEDQSGNRADPGTGADLTATAYELDVTIDFEAERLRGECRLTVRNAGDRPAASVPLLLFRTLEVDTVSGDGGAPLDFEQRVRSLADWPQRQVNVIRVHLDEPIVAGAERTFRLSYQGYLLGYVETGMRYVRDRIDPDFTILRPDALAYPVVGAPSWAAMRAAGKQWFSYVLRVEVPTGYQVANGGDLIDTRHADGRVTYTYRSRQPDWRIDAAIARYELVDSSRCRIFCFPEDRRAAGRIAVAFEDAVDLMSGWFGPLEETAGFTVIEIPEGWGSQTDVATIIQTADAFRDSTRLPELYHEIAHLWNVDETGPSPPRFESEGFAMFLQYLVSERLDGDAGAVESGFERSAERFRAACSKHPGYAGVAMIDHGREGVTGLSYSKGMLFWTLLFDLVGEQAFRDIVGSFYREHHQDGATTEEFLRHVAARSPVDLGRFLEEWVQETTASRLILDGKSREELVARYR
jgi:hypothetical protein